jgi:lysozyme
MSTLKQGLRSKLIASFLALGLSAPAAFVAYDLTIPAEGMEQKVYVDPVGLPTVCVGHMDKALKKGQTFSIEECMDMFAKDWKKHQKQLDSVVKVPYKSEWQREALTDFTFNLGIGNVKSSTLLSLVNQSKHTEACRQLTRWVKGKVRGKMVTLKGLVTRRDKTMPYCLGELSWGKQQEFKQFEAEYNEALKRQAKDTP